MRARIHVHAHTESQWLSFYCRIVPEHTILTGKTDNEGFARQLRSGAHRHRREEAIHIDVHNHPPIAPHRTDTSITPNTETNAAATAAALSTGTAGVSPAFSCIRVADQGHRAYAGIVHDLLIASPTCANVVEPRALEVRTDKVRVIS